MKNSLHLKMLSVAREVTPKPPQMLPGDFTWLQTGIPIMRCFPLLSASVVEKDGNKVPTSPFTPESGHTSQQLIQIARDAIYLKVPEGSNQYTPRRVVGGQTGSRTMPSGNLVTVNGQNCVMQPIQASDEACSFAKSKITAGGFGSVGKLRSRNELRLYKLSEHKADTGDYRYSQFAKEYLFQRALNTHDPTLAIPKADLICTIQLAVSGDVRESRVMLTMDFIDGLTVDRLMFSEDIMLIMLMRDIVPVLKACSDLGIAHCDLNMRNIMRGKIGDEPKRRYYLLDLGLAMHIDELNKSQSFVGSPECVSPEMALRYLHRARRIAEDTTHPEHHVFKAAYSYYQKHVMDAQTKTPVVDHILAKYCGPDRQLRQNRSQISNTTDMASLSMLLQSLRYRDVSSVARPSSLAIDQRFGEGEFKKDTGLVDPRKTAITVRRIADCCHVIHTTEDSIDTLKDADTLPFSKLLAQMQAWEDRPTWDELLRQIDVLYQAR